MFLTLYYQRAECNLFFSQESIFLEDYRGVEDGKRDNKVIDIDKDAIVLHMPVKRKPEKRALIVGISYPKTTSAYLRGAVNDARSIHRLLSDKYGFKNIRVVTDTRESPIQPTARNIFNELCEMCSTAQPGDVVLFHFSGHGVQVECLTDSEADGLDECLVGVDFNLIRDNDLHYVVSLLPSSVNFTFIADCCHSGTMLDLDVYHKASNPLPPEPEAQTPNEVLGDAKERSLGKDLIFKYGEKFLERFTHDSGMQIQRPASLGPNRGILFSACRDDQRSLDLYVSEFERYHGVLSSALLSILKKNKHITNGELLQKLHDNYRTRGVRLCPLLNCLPEFREKHFLEPFTK